MIYEQSAQNCHICVASYKAGPKSYHYNPSTASLKVDAKEEVKAKVDLQHNWIGLW